MKNRKFWVSLLAGIMAGVMLLGLVLSILPQSVFAAQTSQEIQQEIDALAQEQANLGDQISDLQGQQNDNWESLEEMVAQKDNIDQQIHVLNTEIENSNQQIHSYSQLICRKQQELDVAEAVHQELNEKNKDRIRSMEEQGKISYWSVLFRANSFTDLIDRLNMIEEIQQADQMRLEELGNAAETVRKAREDLTAEKQELEQIRKNQLAAQEELNQKRQEADEILTELNQRQRELVAMAEEYQAMAEALSAEIAAAEQAFTEAKRAEEEAKRREEEEKRQQEQQNSGDNSQDESTEEEESAPPPSSDEGWVTPCSYIMITSNYGWRTHPITGNQSFHNGLDMANNEGTPIYAARSGDVTTATYNGVYGYYVTINHGDGYSSLYGHMTSYVVSSGEYVQAGQLIGYMGSTGWSTGPHLHFTIYYDGDTVNPMEYI